MVLEKDWHIIAMRFDNITWQSVDFTWREWYIPSLILYFLFFSSLITLSSFSLPRAFQRFSRNILRQVTLILLHRSCDRVSEKVTRDKGRRVVTPSTSLSAAAAVVACSFFRRRRKKKKKKWVTSRPFRTTRIIWRIRDLYISLIHGDGRAR